MVQTQATSNQLDCQFSNTAKKTGTELYVHKIGFQTKHNTQEQNVIKDRHKTQGIKLQPLNVSKEPERKTTSCTAKNLFIRLSSNQNVSGVRKIVPSKIPVLQKSFIFKSEKNDRCHRDSTLSAADRRQKFHQSRQHVTPACKDCNTYVQVQQNKIAICNDFIPWCDTNYLTKVNLPIHDVCPKTVLPPIKKYNHTVLESRQPKKKCLMGEITHFPALCIASKPVRNPTISTIPHLPPILPPPAAPPPSISTSLEQDANKVK